MDEIEAQLKVDEDQSRLEIELNGNGSIFINYSSDVDFTPLVERLAELLATEKIVSTSKLVCKSEGEKLKLVLETVSAIVSKFNEVQVVSETDTGSESQQSPF